MFRSSLDHRSERKSSTLRHGMPAFEEDAGDPARRGGSIQRGDRYAGGRARAGHLSRFLHHHAGGQGRRQHSLASQRSPPAILPFRLRFAPRPIGRRPLAARADRLRLRNVVRPHGDRTSRSYAGRFSVLTTIVGCAPKSSPWPCTLTPCCRICQAISAGLGAPHPYPPQRDGHRHSSRLHPPRRPG